VSPKRLIVDRPKPQPSADRLRAAFMAGWEAGRHAVLVKAPDAYAAWLASQPQEPKPPAPFYQAGAEDVR
jgi:hypothetical protein